MHPLVHAQKPFVEVRLVTFDAYGISHTVLPQQLRKRVNLHATEVHRPSISTLARSRGKIGFGGDAVSLLVSESLLRL